MKININHVAKLANLSLNEEEEKRFSQQLQDTITYIDHLNEINSDKVEITSQVTGLENIMDEDEILPSLSQENSLMNAKNTKNGQFVVKQIIEN